MIEKKHITAIILAGGKSSRMGEDKAFLKVKAKTMIEHVIAAVKPITKDIIIIANDKKHEQFGYPVYKDLITNCGPLAGIYTGLTFSETTKNLIISCDIPMLSTQLLQSLIQHSEGYEVCVPKNNHKLHPLIGVYSKSCLPVFEKELNNKQRKIQIALQKVPLKVMDADNFDPQIFTNVNTKTELNNLS